MKALEDVLVVVTALVVLFGVYAMVYGIGVAMLVWAWNTLLAGVFHLPVISFMQGVALAVLLSTVRTTVSFIKSRNQA